MASLRTLKKEIDYCLEELVFDCYMAMYVQAGKESDIFAVMQKGVDLRNEFYKKVNNPAEPHNASLVRKHYAALRAEMEERFGQLFEELSNINK